MAFGVTATGFELKRLSDIKTEWEQALRSGLGASIDTLAPSVIATIVGIGSDRESKVWEQSQDLYSARSPETATGAALDDVVALTGIERLQATKSRQLGFLLFGTLGSLVPAGKIYSVQGNSTARFLQDADATLGAGVDAVQTITFPDTPTSGLFTLQANDEETDAIAFNATAQQVEDALNALDQFSEVSVAGTIAGGLTVTFGGDDGKQPQTLLVVEQNTLNDGIDAVVPVIATLTEGEAQATVTLTAETAGAIQARARTLSVIETPVAGLDRVKNPSDAVTGRNRETDKQLLARRDETIQIAGNATIEAIRSKFLNMDGVTDCIIFENFNEVTVDGRPPKTYETVVNGGGDQAIVDLLWATMPAGIRPIGSESGSVTDSQGFVRTFGWSRPTVIPIYLVVDITKNQDYPATGDALVKDALVTAGDAIGIGAQAFNGLVVVSPYLISAVQGIAGLTDKIPGIIGITIKIGTAPAPTLSTNLEVAKNEIPDFDTVRTQVTSHV